LLSGAPIRPSAKAALAATSGLDEPNRASTAGSGFFASSAAKKVDIGGPGAARAQVTLSAIATLKKKKIRNRTAAPNFPDRDCVEY